VADWVDEVPADIKAKDRLYKSGHAIWERMEKKRDQLDFLDNCFGPAK
jgi:hypothetical protein